MAPSPYYQDDWVTIYHGDCHDVGSIHAHRLITDPPYGTAAYPTDKAPDLGHIAAWVDAVHTAAIFGYPETLARWCGVMGNYPAEWVTWWPTNPMRGRDGLLQRESEHVAIFGDVPGAKRIWVTRSESAKRIARKFAGGGKVGADHDNRRAGDVWTDPKPGSAFTAKRKLHPNEKPLALMARLIELCSNPGDVVLDPFMGSGTTLRAAKDRGRYAVGIEIEERYCQVAAERCAQEVLAA